MSTSPHRGRRLVLFRWLLGTIALAGAYCAAAKLGFLFAAPPEYATAIWPASGLALIAVLVFGFRASPGILLGSFLVNLWALLGSPGEGQTASPWVLSIIGLGIGTGGAIQAAAGAWLIGRTTGFPSPLNKEQDIFKFLALGGPVSCLISATVGVTVLTHFGRIGPADYASSWWIWWSGDTVGVVIFAPVALALAGIPRDVWRHRRVTVALPLLVAFVLLSGLYASMKERELVLAGGLIFSSLLSFFLLAVTGRTGLIEQVVAQRTTELTLANRKLAKEVSERRRVQQELQQAKIAAEEANSAKSELLANMSHEIRTPMTAILGFSESLADDGLSDDERIDMLRTITENGHYLIAIINDILDFSKIEAGKLETEVLDCNIFELMKGVQDLMEPRARAKGLELQVLYANLVPETIKTDPTRLRQIFINLLGNAIKFTEQGMVFLCVVASEEEPSEETIHFIVMDSGIGMSSDRLDDLFQPFAQADTSTTREYGGTGLGLSITKHLVSLLGGEIQVFSRPGQGSAFRVTIPTGPLDGVRRLEEPLIDGMTEPRERIDNKQLEISARILLAEDNLVNQKLVARILEKSGAAVSIAQNGREAVDLAFVEQGKRTPFDVVLMDMQMPVLDGYDATRELRDRGYDRPIVALTASALASDRKRCFEVGCDAYISKPINRAEFLEEIARLIAVEPSA